MYVTLRNQIGYGAAEATHINNTIAYWGSVTDTPYFPSGPARSDYSFSYQLGGHPSCHSNAPYGVVTYCLADINAAGRFKREYDSSAHWEYTYILIDVPRRDYAPVYCHEFGHALGLKHRSNTCLNSVATSAVPPDPKQHNLDLSLSINSHTHCSPYC